jgi:hypothetical protein
VARRPARLHFQCHLRVVERLQPPGEQTKGRGGLEKYSLALAVSTLSHLMHLCCPTSKGARLPERPVQELLVEGPFLRGRGAGAAGLPAFAFGTHEHSGWGDGDAPPALVRAIAFGTRSPRGWGCGVGCQAPAACGALSGADVCAPAGHAGQETGKGAMLQPCLLLKWVEGLPSQLGREFPAEPLELR